MRLYRFALLPLFVFALLPGLFLPRPALSAARPLPGETAIQAEDMRRDVEFLANPESGGRGTAQGPLETRVTEYVEKEFKRLGLKPGGVDGTYRQPWTYRSWSQLGFFAPPVQNTPPGRFGVEPNQDGLAFTPQGNVVTTEPIPGIPGVAPATPNTHNLLAMVPGSDPALAGEVVVAGAHMDHLGKRSSSYFPGADDNGSGTAGLLAMARALTEAKNAGHGPNRSVLLILFSGEERGLLGSQYFVGKPTVPLSSIVGMVNLDMIGRQGPTQVSCWDQGKPNGPNLFHDLHDLDGLGFTRIDHDIQRYAGQSDQGPFMRKGIPIVFFFEGFSADGELNPDYHGRTDTADKVDYDKAARIARLAHRHVLGAANHPK